MDKERHKREDDVARATIKWMLSNNIHSVLTEQSDPITNKEEVRAQGVSMVEELEKLKLSIANEEASPLRDAEMWQIWK